MEFYRYEESQHADINDFGEAGSSIRVNVKLITLNLHKETPQGFWIGYGYADEGQLRSTSTWVSKTGKKRYAYPTKKLALQSFFKRKKQQVRILKNQLRRAEIALMDADEMLKIAEKEWQR